jgi:hypothetical protein
LLSDKPSSFRRALQEIVIMFEKRKHRRTGLLYYLKVYDLDTAKYLGHLVDISSGGFKMLSNFPLATGQDLHLQVHLPEIVCGYETFTVKAKPCWCKRDLNPDYFATGFKFIALSTEGIKIIRALIQLYELDNNVKATV